MQHSVRETLSVRKDFRYQKKQPARFCLTGCFLSESVSATPEDAEDKEEEIDEIEI